LQIAILRGGALGDIVLTLPILGALRDYYPGCVITLVAPFPQANLAASGYADRVLDLNSAKFVGLFSPDAVIAEVARQDLTADLILSYLSDPAGVVRSRLMAHQRPATKFVQGPFKLDLERRPATEQLAQPLRALGVPLVDLIPRLASASPKPRLDRLVIHPGSGSPKKNWPPRYWVELLAKLMPAFDEVILVSGEADTEVTRSLVPMLPPNKLQLFADRSLWDLAGELSRAALFIGHDSGVTHLAAAAGIRTVALFGPTDPMIWAPLGDHVTVIRSPDGTMPGLSVETVLHTVEHLLG
jgi:heptosyltransferase-3